MMESRLGTRLQSASNNANHSTLLKKKLENLSQLYLSNKITFISQTHVKAVLWLSMFPFNIIKVLALKFLDE